MRSELSDSHRHRLAGVSYQHVLVPRDDLDYFICSSILQAERKVNACLFVQQN